MRSPGRTRATAVAVPLSVAVATVVGVAACAPLASPAPSPSTPPPPATASPTPSASPSPAEATVDLTEPGVARAVVDELLAASGARRAIMVSVSRTEASVAVVEDGVAQTWAYRDGTIAPVQSDIHNVDQATFVPDDYALDDVGALFRAGVAVSGSDAGQELQIVEYSGGQVSMTVTTNPESRTVFFHPDGTLVPTLDFTSGDGVRTAYEAAVGRRGSVLQLGFGSDLGVYADVVGDEPGTITRHQRPARTPVIVTQRTEATTLRPFDPALVDPDVVWQVVDARRDAGAYTYDQPWSCLVDRREGATAPRLHCTIGSDTVTTDLTGRPLPG